MKNIFRNVLKILFTLSFITIFAFAIKGLVSHFSDLRLFFVIVASILFISHLWSWIAPKSFCKMCWKMSRFLPDSYDYDTLFSHVPSVGLGMAIASNIFLGLAFIPI